MQHSGCSKAATRLAGGQRSSVRTQAFTAYKKLGYSTPYPATGWLQQLLISLLLLHGTVQQVQYINVCHALPQGC